MGFAEKGLKELELALRNIQPHEHITIANFLNNLGVAYGERGDTGKAEDFFIKSLEHHEKGELITFCNLIHLYFKTKNIDKAKVQIDKALSIYNDNPLLLSFLGEHYARSHEYFRAESIYQKALNLDPNIITPYVALSTILIDVIGDTERALELLSRGLKKHPESIPLINNYAYALVMEDKLVEARRVLDKVKDENYVFLNATRGLLLIREGNINEGRRYYNKAMELAKSTDKNLMALVNQKKHLELGRYYIEKGKSRG